MEVSKYIIGWEDESHELACSVYERGGNKLSLWFKVGISIFELEADDIDSLIELLNIAKESHAKYTEDRESFLQEVSAENE